MTYASNSGSGHKGKKPKSYPKGTLYGAKPASDAYIQQVLGGMLAQGAMGGNTTPASTYVNPGKNVPESAPGGQEMRTAPKVTMKAKPKKSVAKQQGDALDALFNQLLSSVSAGGGSQVDYESALRQSEQAIRDAYANDIHAIRSGNVAARKNTAVARRQMEAMYNQLAKSYRKEGNVSSKQAANLANQIQANSERSANFVQKNADQSLADQAALAKGLGIEAAMPAASKGQTQETSKAVKRLVSEGANVSNQQLAFGGNQTRFMRRGAMNSKLEGANRSGDLLANLQNYIQGNLDKIAGLKGQRGREIAANKATTMKNVSDMQSTADKEMWDRLMGLANLKLDINKEKATESNNLAKLQASIASKSGGSANSMPGAASFQNAQTYLSQMPHPKAGTNIFDQFLNSQPMTTGSYYDKNAKTDYKMTPYKAMQMIEQQAKAQGLNSTDINLLRLAVWAQMGGK